MNFAWTLNTYKSIRWFQISYYISGLIATLYSDIRLKQTTKSLLRKYLQNSFKVLYTKMCSSKWSLSFGEIIDRLTHFVNVQ